MKISTKIHILRALVAYGMIGIITFMSNFPDFVVPGLFLLLALMALQLKLWRLLSQATVAKTNLSNP